MDIKLCNESYSESFIFHEGKAEQSIEAELKLPEYCPDIKRVLKCFAVTNIFNCGISGDRATADGEITLKVIYTGDEGKLYICEEILPFSKYTELRDVSGDMTVCVKAKTDYLNCRALSSRRLSVSGNVTLIFTVRKKAENTLVSSCEGQGTELYTENIQASCLLGEAVKTFEMGETAVISEGLPIGSLIRSCAYALIDSIKTVKDKMLIKGDMNVDIIYTEDGENGGIRKFTHTMPISQIIEVSGIDENSVCDVNIMVCAVTVTPKTDSNGEKKLISMTVKANAEVCCYGEKEYTCTLDCYSTEKELNCEYKNISFKKRICAYKEKKNIRSSFDAEAMTEISDVFPVKYSVTSIRTDEGIQDKGECIVGLLYKDREGEYGYTEKTVEIEFSYDFPDKDKELFSKPHMSIGDIRAELSNGKCDTVFTAEIYMPVFEENNKKVCTEIIPGDDKSPKKDSMLTVYFPEEGEKLWDIAKKYNTTVERIKEENAEAEEGVLVFSL